MTIALPPELMQRLEAERAAGRIDDPEAWIARAIAAQLDALEAFRRSLDEAEAQIARGEGVPLDTVLADSTDPPS